MMHLKNITAQNPKQLSNTSWRDSINFLLWLFSDDGQEWHEAQENFSQTL